MGRWQRWRMGPTGIEEHSDLFVGFGQEKACKTQNETLLAAAVATGPVSICLPAEGTDYVVMAYVVMALPKALTM